MAFHSESTSGQVLVSEEKIGSVGTAFMKDVKEYLKKEDLYDWRVGVQASAEVSAMTYLFGWKRYGWKKAVPYMSNIYGAVLLYQSALEVENRFRNKPYKPLDKYDKCILAIDSAYVTSRIIAYQVPKHLSLHSRFFGNYYGISAMTSFAILGVCGAMIGTIAAVSWKNEYEIWERKTKTIDTDKIVETKKYVFNPSNGPLAKKAN